MPAPLSMSVLTVDADGNVDVNTLFLDIYVNTGVDADVNAGFCVDVEMQPDANGVVDPMTDADADADADIDVDVEAGKQKWKWR